MNERMKMESRHNTYIVGCDCKFHHRTDQVEIQWDLLEDPGRGLVGEIFFLCPTMGNVQSGRVYRGG